jgi:hypothetical protein
MRRIALLVAASVVVWGCSGDDSRGGSPVGAGGAAGIGAGGTGLGLGGGPGLGGSGPGGGQPTGGTSAVGPGGSSAQGGASPGGSSNTGGSGPGGGTTGGSGPGGTGQGGGAPSCTRPGGFAAVPASYGIPAPRCGQGFDAPASSGSLVFSLLRLGDPGRSDLIVTNDSCDPDVGTTRWDVYAGGPTSFGATPSAYLIPAARCNQPFDAASGYGGVDYALGRVGSTTGLVVVDDDCDEDVGTKRWDVYAAGPNGFAATPQAYGIPPARCNQPFDAFSGFGNVSYALLDMGGDGTPDLVVTRDGCDPDIGSSRWDVYVGGPTGFASAPQAYTLPAARCNTPFDAFANPNGLASFTSLDLDHDGRLDLVVTYDDCDSTVGKTHWDYYPGGATGFAAVPSSFGIPAPRCNQPFSAVSASSTLSYSIFSLDGCGTLDLVVTDDTCDSDVGSVRWDVYAWSKTGFSATPSAFGIPAARCNTRFSQLSGYSGITYGTAPLPSSTLSLIVYRDDCDDAVGTSRWDLYAAK